LLVATSHAQREEHYYWFDSCVLGGIVHYLASVPVEISLETVGESKRIGVVADEYSLV
jgi:hypothetical protein